MLITNYLLKIKFIFLCIFTYEVDHLNDYPNQDMLLTCRYYYYCHIYSVSDHYYSDFVIHPCLLLFQLIVHSDWIVYEISIYTKKKLI